MTTPNQPAPDGAISDGDLSPLDGLSESAWRSNINAQVMNGDQGGWNGVHGVFGSIFGGLAAIFNGWFGSGGVGSPQEVQYTIEAIKDAILAGYQVRTYVTSGQVDFPSGMTECHALIVGGGRNGADGSDGARANGGLGGGYISVPLEPDNVNGQTVDVTIGGANGGATTFRAVTGPSAGQIIAEVQSGASGGIATGVFGYAPTTSAPGNGGRGGLGYMADTYTASAGDPGSGSAVGAGGVGGATKTTGNADPGGAGGNVSAGAAVKCAGGGGGGGGGGGRDSGPFNVAYSGGAGGPGGYPGGGGGGGGGRGRGISSGLHGAGGIGAVGVAWLVWKS